MQVSKFKIIFREIFLSFYSSEEGNLQFNLGQFNKLNNEMCSRRIINDIIGRNKELIDLPIGKSITLKEYLLRKNTF